MASSGKKSKKTKGKTLALTAFLQETPGAIPSIPLRKTNLNWADEVEDVCDSYESRPKANVVLPTAPKASRGFDEFNENIPQHPPYIAYLSNLPYDVNEDEIAEFFGELKIANMRIPKEDRAGEGPRLKGFGYVEFEEREGLVGAIRITDCTLKNRRIRIEVATNLESDRRRGRMDNNRDRPDRGAETSGDWRSGPRVEPTEPERSRGGGFNRDREGGFNRDRDGGGGFSRDRDGGGFSRDREGGFNRDREGGFTRDRDSGFSRDRDGGAERDRGSWRDATDRPSFRDTDRDRGFSRDSERSGGFGDRNRFNDRDGEKRSFGPRRNDRDDREFTRGGGGGGGRDDAGSERSDARARPKLLLAPRTKPKEATLATEPNQDASQEKEIIPISVPASSASIFGNAKPVDTSIRERQIEDRLAKETEKPASEPARDGRREMDRRDWGRRNDDDSKWGAGRRRDSPRRYSPRRSSPEYRGSSSPDRAKNSNDRRRHSPNDRRSSPDRSGSPDYRRDSSNHRSESPDDAGTSPARQTSPDNSQANRGSFPRKNDDKDKRGPPKIERPAQKNDKHKQDEKVARDNHDRDMPKLKEPAAPNFAVSNKYAFLEPEGDSD